MFFENARIALTIGAKKIQHTQIPTSLPKALAIPKFITPLATIITSHTIGATINATQGIPEQGESTIAAVNIMNITSDVGLVSARSAIV